MPTVLIVEDISENQRIYENTLQMAEDELQFHLAHQLASTFEEAVTILEESATKPELAPALILLDMEIPFQGHKDKDAGYRLIERYRKRFPDSYWVPLTAIIALHEKEAREESALFDKLYKLEPFDVLSKGSISESGNLKRTISEALELIKQTSENALHSAQIASLTESGASFMQRFDSQGKVRSWVLPTYQLFREIRKAAESKRNIFLFGEEGTGKTYTAEIIHHYSIRSSYPFNKVDGKVDAGELEKLLFPSEKDQKESQILLDQTQGGTLYISDFDQLGGSGREESLRLQRKLRHYLVYRKYNVRIIAGINKKRNELPSFDTILPELLEPARAIDIPSLNERKNDIPALIKCFQEDFTQNHPNQKSKNFTDLPEVCRLLQAQDWQQGNISRLYAILAEAFSKVHEPVILVTTENVQDVLEERTRQPVLKTIQVPDGKSIHITRKPFVVTEEDLRKFGIH